MSPQCKLEAPRLVLRVTVKKKKVSKLQIKQNLLRTQRPNNVVRARGEVVGLRSSEQEGISSGQSESNNAVAANGVSGRSRESEGSSGLSRSEVDDIGRVREGSRGHSSQGESSLGRLAQHNGDGLSRLGDVHGAGLGEVDVDGGSCGRNRHSGEVSVDGSISSSNKEMHGVGARERGLVRELHGTIGGGEREDIGGEGGVISRQGQGHIVGGEEVGGHGDAS